MAYDMKFAERVRAELYGLPFVEKKMFGGLGYLINGNMICGWYKGDMVARIDPAKHDAFLKKNHVKPFALRGKPMKGWLLIEPDGFKTAKQLSAWVKIGFEFASTLPPK
ncbi:MAG: TfoX/Sxy family protein [Chloroflexi bacterium]|nr:TfoX/Sxy family protein [Chloroflexota bacterium]